jgi:hypothetical protein
MIECIELNKQSSCQNCMLSCIVNVPIKISRDVWELHFSMPLFKVVQAIQSAGTGVVRLDLRRTVVVLLSVDDQDVGIGDGGGPARSSSIRTRATVAEVTGWRFTLFSWDPANISIRWEHISRLSSLMDISIC